jgi:hypothetical protein
MIENNPEEILEHMTTYLKLNDKEFFLKLAYYFLEGHSGENRCKLEMA